MAIDDGGHRAHCEEGPDGKWSGGCTLCGTHFGGAERLGAESWVSGHDSAVVCTRRVAEKTGPRFPKVRPGEALDLQELRDTLNDLELQGLELVLTEVVQPMDQVPVLYLWTPPTEEGWHREPIGALYLDSNATFVPAPAEAEIGEAGDVEAGSD